MQNMLRGFRRFQRLWLCSTINPHLGLHENRDRGKRVSEKTYEFIQIGAGLRDDESRNRSVSKTFIVTL